MGMEGRKFRSGAMVIIFFAAGREMMDGTKVRAPLKNAPRARDGIRPLFSILR